MIKDGWLVIGWVGLGFILLAVMFVLTTRKIKRKRSKLLKKMKQFQLVMLQKDYQSAGELIDS